MILHWQQLLLYYGKELSSHRLKCVLQVGASLSRRGEILLEGIECIAGRGHVRLS